jgi:16S rRNA (cytidine1402-2'-O)-methyltransferase
MIEKEHSGVLYVVATPIGNLEDITFRAIRILQEVEYILCEDTRVTRVLLSHYNISTPLRRYDAHTSQGTHVSIIDDINAGKKIALVSDAGTPGVSDPGVLLIQMARAAGARIDAIPGPSAVTAAISIAGLPGNQFTFLGFIPQKKGRETFLKNLRTYTHPVVFFESTHRILKLLSALTTHLPHQTIYLGRELTKFHEEMIVGNAQEVLLQLEATPVRQKGEFVIVLAPATE